jgi:hypothetical protein
MTLTGRLYSKRAQHFCSYEQKVFQQQVKIGVAYENGNIGLVTHSNNPSLLARFKEKGILKSAWWLY